MESLKKLIVLTGAGMSAESGIATFRGAGGLWEGHRVEEVATPAAFLANPGLVLDFYNRRRKNVLDSEPNRGHVILKELEDNFSVTIITQNVDDLHERAGSSHIIHLHGELIKARSTADPSLIFKIDGTDLILGDKCPKGSQLRPHIVWFGEGVPLMEDAKMEVESAEVIIIVGTSMQVYPAASLVEFAKPGVPIYLVDPNPPKVSIENLQIIAKGASEGLALVASSISPR